MEKDTFSSPSGPKSLTGGRTHQEDDVRWHHLMGTHFWVWPSHFLAEHKKVDHQLDDLFHVVSFFTTTTRFLLTTWWHVGRVLFIRSLALPRWDIRKIVPKTDTRHKAAKLVSLHKLVLSSVFSFSTSPSWVFLSSSPFLFFIFKGTRGLRCPRDGKH